MGLFLRQDDQRSEIQKRVATELHERLRQTTPVETGESEPSMLENQHTTRKAGMIIMVLLAFLFIAIVAFAIRIS
jgi:hypothetical protein